MRELRFRSGGTELWAGVVGSEEPGAPTAILLHPTPLDHRFWLPLLPQLPSTWRYVLADLRGHGRSPLGGLTVLTMDQLGRDAVALADALGVEQAVWIGCSIGGYTLYELWRQAPGRVRALAFCSAKPHADGGTDREGRLRWIAHMEARAAAGEQEPGDEFIEAMVAALVGAEARTERAAALDELRGMMRQLSPATVAAIQRGLGARPDSRETARSVPVMSCVIAAAEDASSTPATMDELGRLLGERGSPVWSYVVARAGHYAPWERSAYVGEILDRFLRSGAF